MIKIKNLKTAIITFVFLATVISLTTIYVPVSAQNIRQNICKGTNLSFSDAPALTRNSGESQEDFDRRVAAQNCTAGANEEGFNKLLAKIVDIISVIVGIIAVIMIIVGGFKYITSGGDSNKVGSAKSTIIYAVVGLVIVAIAQFVVKFVLGQSATLVP